MHRRLILAMAAFPLLAQAGCSEQDVVGLVTVIIQTLLTSMIPVLVSLLLGGGGAGLGI